jgi:hypothetical protein
MYSRRALSYCKTPYKLSVKLSDLTVWRHTWRRNWVNCAVFTGNSAGLRTVLSSRLSHTELRSSLRDSTVSSVYLPTLWWHHLKALSLPKWIKERRPLRPLKRTYDSLIFIHHSHAHKTHKTDKKTDKPDGKPVLCQRTFSSVFRAVFTVKLHSLERMGPLTHWSRYWY